MSASRTALDELGRTGVDGQRRRSGVQRRSPAAASAGVQRRVGALHVVPDQRRHLVVDRAWVGGTDAGASMDRGGIERCGTVRS